MRLNRIESARIALAGALLVAGAAQAQMQLDFIASSPAYGYAAKAYKAIWEEYGERIVAALEKRTCMPFPELESVGHNR